eukprot:245755-Pelagomonas_calceolata.AAC.2
MIWIIQHSCPLESQTFQFEPADYLWMLCVCGGLLIVSTFFTGFVINGVPLIMAIIYVWSRNFPEQQVGSTVPGPVEIATCTSLVLQSAEGICRSPAS